MDNATVTVKFQHPVTDEIFVASRNLDRGCNFSLERYDREENCMTYCGDVTPYTPSPVRDALCLAIGQGIYLNSFTPEQLSLFV